MSKMKPTGSFVALITPFNKDGSVDFAAFATLLEFQRAYGSSAVLIMGSTGETSMLSPEEKQKIIVETAKMKTPRMPIFFGCTGNNTEATIANVRFARDNGADGAILAAPAYICAAESDIERFFLEVADATDLPLGIYNNPPRVKTDLRWDQLLRIFKHPNYVVHKESTARVGQVAQVLAGRPDVSVMCCDSPNLGLVVSTMSLGGHGRGPRNPRQKGPGEQPGGGEGLRVRAGGGRRRSHARGAPARRARSNRRRNSHGDRRRGDGCRRRHHDRARTRRGARCVPGT